MSRPEGSESMYLLDSRQENGAQFLGGHRGAIRIRGVHMAHVSQIFTEGDMSRA